MPTRCLNCGEAVTHNFCPACGQAAEDRRGPLFGFLGDFFAEFFSIDGRHLRTAVMLWRPGRLTQFYLEGKRASYVPPVRIYFVASLLFFLLVGFPVPKAENFNVWVDDMVIGRDEPDPKLGDIQLLSLDKTSPVNRWVGPYLAPKLGKLQAMSAQELLDGFVSGLERTVPTTLIVFVALLALALKLLYIRRSFFYVDHLVFALHFQSFMFMVLVLARLANMVALGRLYPGVLSYIGAFFLILPVYMVVALRRVYGQSWALTLAKGALLGILYLLLIQPVLLVTFFLVIRAM
jgi:hypothetical protein